MQKWNEPKGPPPSHLDLADEITHEDVHRFSKDRFAVECMEACLRLGCAPKQAAGVTANVLNESAWGQACRAHNYGGWKLFKPYAAAYRKAHGKGPPWWRAPGNKAPGATLEDHKGGDPPWCFYRAFDSLDDFLANWLLAFVPKPAPGAPSREGKGDPATADYRLAGERFWNGRSDWFAAMVAAGYKGTRTEAHPDQAIAEYHSLAKGALTRWAQARLRIKVDGIWGSESTATCRVFQTCHGLEATGALDDVTLLVLAKFLDSPAT